MVNIQVNFKEKKMAFQLGYSSLRWQTPDLPKVLGQMKAAGWEGWELRQSLEFLGSPERVRKICDDAGMPVAVVSRWIKIPV